MKARIPELRAPEYGDPDRDQICWRLADWSARVAGAAGFEPPSSAEERRALFRRGAQLWPIYCNTCHNARPAAEFSATEWNLILMHMRTQANLPAADARAVLEYLKSSR